MRLNLDEAVKAVVGIVADAHGIGTVNGTGIDTLGFNEALIIVNSGINGTSGTVDVKVQESDALASGYADISGAAFTQITESNDNTIYVGRVKLADAGRKRYIRIVAVVATAACDAGVAVILGKAENLAVSQVNSVGFSK